MAVFFVTIILELSYCNADYLSEVNSYEKLEPILAQVNEIVIQKKLNLTC